MPKKTNTKIKLGNDYSFRILHKRDDTSIDTIKTSIKDKLPELEDFYQLKITNLEIELIYSREEFNQIVGRDTPAWMVALSKPDKIYIFSPKAVNDHSSHGKSGLGKTIVHELVHMFNDRINKNLPLWLDEGMALYLADQKKEQDFSKENWNYFLKHHLSSRDDVDDFAAHEGYKISYKLVKRILERHGKDKLMSILKE